MWETFANQCKTRSQGRYRSQRYAPDSLEAIELLYATDGGSDGLNGLTCAAQQELKQRSYRCNDTAYCQGVGIAIARNLVINQNSQHHRT